jgi:hypothetical protein
MRKTVAMILAIAVLGVSAVPIIPGQPVCVHAAERVEDCEPCHDTPAGHKMLDAGQYHDMGHAAYGSMDDTSHNAGRDETAKTGSSHQHNNEMSLAGAECRIECGCGCHSSVDGLPHLLAPHTVSLMDGTVTLDIVRLDWAAEPSAVPVCPHTPATTQALLVLPQPAI